MIGLSFPCYKSDNDKPECDAPTNNNNGSECDDHYPHHPVYLLIIVFRDISLLNSVQLTFSAHDKAILSLLLLFHLLLHNLLGLFIVHRDLL